MKRHLFFFILLLLPYFSVQSQSFTNVAAQLGINADYIDLYYIPGGGAGFADYDNDGDPDLIIATKTHFKVYKNDNNSFIDVTAGSGISLSGDCLKSVVCGDYNNDGWLDLFVTNGGGGPNFLYKNNQNGTFTRITSGAIVTDTMGSFGCNWGDLDNDGDLDLFVANNYNQKDALYRNDGNNVFTKITADVSVSENNSSVGSALADFNNDGKLDIFVVNQGYGGPSENDCLFKNVGAEPWYLLIKFNGGGIGVRVKIRIGNYIAIREVTGGNSCSSQDMTWVHFGLGFLNDTPVQNIDSVIVDWHDGFREIRTNVAPNQELEFGGIIGVQQISSEIPQRFSLSQNYPNPFNPVTNFYYALPKGSDVKLVVYNTNGQIVKEMYNGYQSAGTYKAIFDGSGYSSGVYFYKIITNDFTETKKMILVK